jgi:hypothetical protein
MTFRPVPKPAKRAKTRRPSDHPFIAWTKAQPCDACGQPGPSEFAHVQGPISLKTGQTLPRRTDHAYLAGIPLCPECHRTNTRSIHAIGEPAFSQEHYGHPFAIVRRAFAYLARWALTRATV